VREKEERAKQKTKTKTVVAYAGAGVSCEDSSEVWLQDEEASLLSTD